MVGANVPGVVHAIVAAGNSAMLKQYLIENPQEVSFSLTATVEPPTLEYMLSTHIGILGVLLCIRGCS